MRVLVELLGEVDPEDLWPYQVRFTATATGGVLVVSLHDSQELVGFLLRLSPLAEIVRVEPLHGTTESGPSPEVTSEE